MLVSPAEEDDAAGGGDGARPVTRRHVRTRTSALRFVDLGAVDAAAWAARHAATLCTSLIRLAARGLGGLAAALAGRFRAAVTSITDGVLRPALRRVPHTPSRLWAAAHRAGFSAGSADGDGACAFADTLQRWRRHRVLRSGVLVVWNSPYFSGFAAAAVLALLWQHHVGNVGLASAYAIFRAQASVRSLHTSLPRHLTPQHSIPRAGVCWRVVVVAHGGT